MNYEDFKEQFTDDVMDRLHIPRNLRNRSIGTVAQVDYFTVIAPEPSLRENHQFSY